jgi:hypothetical protein
MAGASGHRQRVALELGGCKWGDGGHGGGRTLRGSQVSGVSSVCHATVTCAGPCKGRAGRCRFEVSARPHRNGGFGVLKFQGGSSGGAKKQRLVVSYAGHWRVLNILFPILGPAAASIALGGGLVLSWRLPIQTDSVLTASAAAVTCLALARKRGPNA